MFGIPRVPLTFELDAVWAGCWKSDKPDNICVGAGKNKVIYSARAWTRYGNPVSPPVFANAVVYVF
jgi:hypothetical protein